MIHSSAIKICFFLTLNFVLSGQVAHAESQFASHKFNTFRHLPYDSTVGLGKHYKSLDIYAPTAGKNHPVVIWVHGGGWQIGDKRGVHGKPEIFTQHGYLLVSINYRLHPRVTYHQQAEDIAQAIHWVQKNVKSYGGNPDEIFLMGHSAGAHLVALVSTNPTYLKAESLSLKVIKGTILLDGAGYDIKERINTARPAARKLYIDVFGTDEKIWKAASPLTYVRHNQFIPPFLIIHVAKRADSKRQSEQLAAKLKTHHISITMFAAQNKTHLTVNSEIGQPDDIPTQKIFAFLKGMRIHTEKQ